MLEITGLAERHDGGWRIVRARRGYAAAKVSDARLV
jgi:DNA processing protein